MALKQMSEATYASMNTNTQKPLTAVKERQWHGCITRRVSLGKLHDGQQLPCL